MLSSSGISTSRTNEPAEFVNFVSGINYETTSVTSFFVFDCACVFLRKHEASAVSARPV